MNCVKVLCIYLINSIYQIYIAIDPPGHVQVDQWLKKNSLPRLPLPNVCGYIPLVSNLADALKDKRSSLVISATGSSASPVKLSITK